MPTTLEWSLALLSNSIHIVLIFIILYCVFKFFRFSKLQALQKRYPFSVYLMTTCVLFYIIQHLTYKITFIHRRDESGTLERLSHPDPSKTQFHLAIISLISKVFYAFSLHGMLMVLIARSWIIYFNTKWGLQIQKSAWSVHLNPHVTSTFWFIEHRKDYGSPRWIKTAVLTYYLVQSVINLVLMLLVPVYNGFIDIIFYLMEFAALVIIYNKIPQFYDVFHIKRELQLILRIGSVGLVLYVAYVIKTAFFGTNLIGFMILQCIFGVVAGSMVVVLNSYVFTAKCVHLLSEIIQIDETEPVQKNSVVCVDTAGSKPTEVRYSLRDVLANDELIQAFFKHLLDEFSVELLLALIEMIQFEELMRNDDVFMKSIQEYIASNSEKHPNRIAVETTLKLADQLPRSHMVFESHAEMKRNTHAKYLLIARDIAKKYVFDDSEFEINISYECKQGILSFIRNCPLQGTLDQDAQYQLFILFWDAKQALLRLMHSSHLRCRNSNRYPANITL